MMILQICMLLKNLIKGTPREKNILISWLSTNSKNQKNYIFLPLKKQTKW